MEWGYLLLPLVLLAYALYTIIPDLFLHRLGVGSWKRQYTSGVAITFDDGPNPEVTPGILDILDKYKVKATFFLVGEKAKKFPVLVKQIKNRGHRIAAHSQYHRHAWLISPWKTWKEWEVCITTLESLTGDRIIMVRPPWGTFNLVTWLWIKYRNKRVVLWNSEGHDWKVNRSPERIAIRILKRCKEGTVVLLHDAGGEKGTSDNTKTALEIICRKIVEEKKLPIVQLDLPQWSGWRRFIFNLWEKWEHLYAKLNHVERINSTNILRVTKTRYKGPNLYGEDGRLLAKGGDFVGEIHIDSNRLEHQAEDVNKTAVATLRKAKQSLPEFARYIVENPKYKDVEVFVGVTLINRGVRGLGFNVQEIPSSWIKHWIGFLQKLIIRIYHPVRKTQVKKPGVVRPKLVWISREQLLQRWFQENKE